MEVRTQQGTMQVHKLPNLAFFEVVITDNGGNVIRVDRIPQNNMEAVANEILEAIQNGASNAELNHLAGTQPESQAPPKLIAKRVLPPANPRTGKRPRS